MASNLKVTDTTVPGVLDAIRKGEWLIPQFQRDFVWGTEQVSELVQSILSSRPIGMITLWEQRAETPMKLERLSIQDANPATGKSELLYFPTEDVVATKTFAVLDGKQRSTAIAMAFGGFRAKDARYRYSGRYFVDIVTSDPTKRVRFFKENVVRDQGLNSDANCVRQGLLPLASNQDGEEVLKQWMRYLRLLSSKDVYADGELPAQEEIDKRTKILEACFEGIVNTKLAVYTVPDVYGLTDICEIFDTLNTTGTKVSTVDLIHSLIYAETFEDAQGPMLLREWMKSFGQRDGAYGWSNPSDRPELTTQLVTATYAALADRPPPRKVGGKEADVSSVKAGDMLAVPSAYWRIIERESETLAQYLGDAQKLLAGGYFPWHACPYPASIGIYLALRWHSKFDYPNGAPWSRDEIDALFRAFFWRNSLSRRYDQGFLTQIGTDISQLKKLLAIRANYQSSAEWAAVASGELTDLFLRGFASSPSEQELRDLALDGELGGALWKALCLPLLDASDYVSCTLKDLDLSVSTGPVVDFRMRNHLRPEPHVGTVPLLYPGHFEGRATRWPIEAFKKSNAIELNEETKKWMYPSGTYTVVRRFSSKEERRRVVASVVIPQKLGNPPKIAFENHLNVFHRRKEGLPEALAWGLFVFLNSAAVDGHFRRFNGHTQVNATDLKNMLYPSLDMLVSMGEWATEKADLTQDEIDAYVEYRLKGGVP